MSQIRVSLARGVVLLLLPLLVCNGAPADVPATRPAAAAVVAALPRDDIPGLPNFARVSPTLYRGAQPTAEGFAELKKMGVKTVVSLRSFTSDRGKLEGTGLRYVRIPCLAWCPEDEDVVRFLKVVTDPANQPVFVHCQHGADRTGYAVAAYRVVEQGWAMADAMRELHAFGFHRVWIPIPHYLRKFDAEAVAAKVKETKPPKVRVVE